MTLTLTVDEPAWRVHVRSVTDRLGARLIPVVKGNGYGFGRRSLAEEVASWDSVTPRLPTIAVGSIFETADINDLAERVLVLTPTLDEHLDALAPNVTLTVGSRGQVEHLVDAGWRGPVVAKVATSMLRHGMAPEELATVGLDRLDVVAVAIHPPLAGTSADHRAEVERLVARLPGSTEIHVSHLAIDDFTNLAATSPGRDWRLRLGTALWHGDKSALRLQAGVLDVRRVTAGTSVGYRLNEVPAAGHLVIIGAGSAHGVVPLADGRSPFHFARRRLDLIENPHMHVSMAFVVDGDPCPAVGDVVDVQRPLISTTPDRIVWTS
jgi:alanine racemase